MSGLWSCSTKEGQHYWSLIKNPKNSSPSVFGASFRNGEIKILSGNLDTSNSTLILLETPTNKYIQQNEETQYLFSGEFITSQEDEEHENLTLIGDYYSQKTIHKGKFASRKEEENEELHISGLWVGESIPDISLAEFWIPNNPIVWSLSILIAGNKGIIFGGGYFDDAGDLPGQPILLFSLFGSFDNIIRGDNNNNNNNNNNSDNDENKSDINNKRLNNEDEDEVIIIPNLKFTKNYELNKNTEGYIVEYYGKLILIKKNGEENYQIKGNWRNEKGGTFGEFYCEKVNNNYQFTDKPILCSNCYKEIKCEKFVWECTKCISQNIWKCCDDCLMNDKYRVIISDQLIKLETNNLHYHNYLSSEIYFQREISDGNFCDEIILNSFIKFPNRKFIGVISTYQTEGEKFYYYHWLTYKEIGIFSIIFATELNNLIQQVNNETKKKYLMIVGDLTPAYVVSLLGALICNFILVPLHGALDISSLLQIYKKIEPSVVIVTSHYREKFEDIFNKLDQSNSLLSLPICIEISQSLENQYSNDYNNLNNNINNKIEINRWNFIDLEKLYEESKDKLKEYQEMVNNKSIDDIYKHIFNQPISEKELRKNNDLVAILFTSGSTGTPKGVLYDEKLVVPSSELSNIQPFIKMDFQRFHPSFIVSLISVMRHGGRRAISTDLSILLESIKAARPTHLSAPPVLFNLLHSEYHSRVQKNFKSYREKILSQKDDREEKEIDQVNGIHLQKKLLEIEKNVKEEIKSYLGNRIISLATGGASISPSILKFCNETLDLNVGDLYGSREAGPIACNGLIYNSVDIVLLPLDDDSNNVIQNNNNNNDNLNINFNNKNEEKRGIGEIGEIAVHSPRLISHYFKDNSLTNKSFIYINDKKYFKTGDIGQFYYQNDGEKRIKVLDRIGFATKMAQGEWLAASSIESILESNPFIFQSFVISSVNFSFPVAVIVPSDQFFENYFPNFRNFMKISFNNHLNNRINNNNINNNSNFISINDLEVGNEIKEQLKECEEEMEKIVRNWSVHHHLAHFPQFISIEINQWTAENSFLTSTLKKNRQKLAKFYSSVSQNLFENSILSRENIEEKEEISKELKELLKEVLPSIEEFPKRYFITQLGADSLIVSKLISLLQSRYSLNINYNSLLQYNLSHLDYLLHSSLEGNLILNSVEPIIDWFTETDIYDLFYFYYSLQRDHNYVNDANNNENNNLNNNNNNNNNNTIDPLHNNNNNNNNINNENNINNNNNLNNKNKLVTGSSGFLGPFLLSEILRYYKHPIKIFCIHRISQSISFTKENIKKPFQKIGRENDWIENEDRIILLDGDLSLPFFGWNKEKWNEISQEINEIFHSGALVNLSMPFNSTLKLVNVNGTKTVIKMAIQSNSKINYVSSVSVLSENGKEEFLTMSALNSIGGKGYGASKAISEILLTKVNEKFGIELNIFRISSISGDTISGYFNTKDFTGLIISISVLIGAIVYSDMKMQWIPVDFVAKAIVLLSNVEEKRRNIYHLCGNGPTLKEVFVQLRKMIKINDKELDVVTAEKWRSLLSRLPPDYFANSILNSFKNLHFENRAMEIDSHLTFDTLTRHYNISHLPIISSDIIDKYLSFLQSSGAFDA